jgi:asparagine synthetase B (glutamine-hydrolysing)
MPLAAGLLREPQPLGPGLYSTDAFHRRPLFAVQPQGAGDDDTAPVVASWEEALALHGPLNAEAINPAWLAALISDRKTADQAPYRRIARLPRAHHVAIQANGRRQLAAYDPLAGGAGPMAPEALHGLIRAGLLSHLQGALAGWEGPIGCEHSSGIDSNAVLGGLVRGLGVAPERIHTWSNEGGGEGPLLEQFRPFYGLSAEQVNRGGPGVATAPDSPDPLPDPLSVLGAPAQIGGMLPALTGFQAAGAAVIFSGFGGDQALSHNACNVATDLVAQGRWRELLAWMEGSPKRAIKTGLGRSLALRSRRFIQHKIDQRTRLFCQSDLLERHLSERGRQWLGPHLQSDHPWEINGYVPLHTSLRQRVLAPWVAVRAEEETRLATAFGLRKAFPLLDERLIGTLLQQDPMHFGEVAGRGRLVARRAFEPFLPPFLASNPSKDREGFEAEHAAREKALPGQLGAALEELQDNLHPVAAGLWHWPEIRREVETLLHQPAPAKQQLMGNLRALGTLKQVNGWLMWLDQQRG